MADPVTASIQIALQAVKTGAAVATWWQTRQMARSEDSTSEATGGYYRQSTEDLLYVMATIGQWLFSLQVVNPTALPAARSAVRQAFTAGDPEDDDLGYTYDNMDELVQNAVASAMVFCAECWPMHIWKGFGCGVFNELCWADPNHSNIHCLELDNSITALKSQPHQWQLLKKSPSAISKQDPETVARDKSVAKKISSLLKDIIQTWEKEGFPQPIDPYDHIRISYWWIPFATWNGGSMYENEGHRYSYVAQHQMDPGRFLWAWTAGKQARLNPGEAVLLIEEHIGALAQWLEGLNGIPFRVILDNQVNYGKIKYGRSARSLLKKNYGNELGVCGLPFVIAHDPKLVVAQPLPDGIISAELNGLKVSSPVVQVQPVSPTSPASPMAPPQYTELPQSPVSPGLSFPDRTVPRRRPAPKPPVVVAVRSVSALHNFVAETAEELSFSAGDVLEIVDDKSGDGWWKAKLGDKTGLIPNSFVTDIAKENIAQLLIEVPDTPRAAPSPAAVSPSSPIQRKPLSSAGTGHGQPFNQPFVQPVTQPFMQPVSDNYFGAQPAATSSSLTDFDYPVDQTRSSLAYAVPIEREAYQPQPQSRSESWSSQMPQEHSYQQHPTPHQLPQQQTPTRPPDEGPTFWGVNPSQGISQPTIARTFYHSKTIKAVAFAPNSNVLASGCKDAVVRLWDTTTGDPLSSLNGHEQAVDDLSFARDGRVLASASEDATVRLWDVRTNGSINTLRTSSWAHGVAFSPDGTRLAVGLLNDKIQIWDGRSMAVLHTIKGHKSIVNSVAFSPEGRVLASGSNDKTVRTWDVAASSSAGPLLAIKAHPGMMNYVMAVAFSPDGGLLASGSLDGNVKLWNAGSGALVRAMKCGAGVNSVAFSPDGRVVAAGNILGKLVMWSCEGVELHNVSAHEKGVESVAFSSDGRLLATASEDKKVKLWKLS